MIIPLSTARAQELAKHRRENRTEAELRMEELLVGHRAWGFEAEVPFGPYVADFLSISCAINLEVDGSVHAKKAQRRHDAGRNQFFSKCGFRIIRVTNEQVWNTPDDVIDRIAETIAGHRPRSSKSRKRRRKKERAKRRRLQKQTNIDRRRLADRAACPIPEVFLSDDVLRAWKGVPPKPKRWDKEANPGVFARPRKKKSKPIEPPKPPKDLRRPGGLYRRWQPPPESI